MTWINLISWYLVIGVLNSIIMTYINDKMIKNGMDSESYTNFEKSLILFYWPFYSLVFLVSFFYNFFKDIFKSKK